MTKVHLGCGTVYLKDYVNVDAKIPGISFLAKDRPDLVEINQTTIDNYYKNKVNRKDIETKKFEEKLIVVDKFADIRRLPFKPNSLFEIRSVQLFEHFSFAEGKALLENWYKLLKKGGVVHIDIPDLDGTLEGYVSAKTQANREWYTRLLFGNQKNEFGFHKAMYSKNSIKKLLIDVGFKKVKFLPNIHFYPAFAVQGIK
jgi:predicted SAM-dependent methyltransferase